MVYKTCEPSKTSTDVERIKQFIMVLNTILAVLIVCGLVCVCVSWCSNVHEHLYLYHTKMEKFPVNVLIKTIKCNIQNTYK